MAIWDDAFDWLGGKSLIGDPSGDIKYSPADTQIGEYNVDVDRAIEEIRALEAQGLPIPEELISRASASRGSGSAIRLREDRNAILGLADQEGGNLLGLTRGAAEGTAPSQAQDTLREGTSRTASSAFGMAAAAPGGGAQRAAAMNAAGWQAAQANQQGARQGAQLRAQEMADGRSQYGQAIQNVGQIYGGQRDADLDRAKANQSAAVAGNTTGANVATEEKKADKGIWGQFLSGIDLSDIRAKEDIRPIAGPVQPTPLTFNEGTGEFDRVTGPSFGATPAAGQAAFTSGLGTGTSADDYAASLDRAAQEDAIRRQVQEGVEDSKGSLFVDKPKKKSGGGGFLGGIFSDERSKERIRTLENALDRVGARSESTANEIYSTKVEYPDGFGPKPYRPEVAPTDLVYDQRSDQFRTPDEQLKYSRALGGSADPLKRPAADRLFVDDDEMAMRTPMEQWDHSQKLASAAGSRDALAPVGEYQYQYKPEFAAVQGTDTEPRVGVMAQDLERSPSPELRSVVVNTPHGKAIDSKRALSANLGLTAGLDKRLREIENSLGGDAATNDVRLGLGRRSAVR